jgi:phage gp45-like
MFDINSLYNVCLKTASSGEETVYLKGENNTNFTTTIQGLTAGQDSITKTPVLNPYGFASMPDNQSYTAIIGNVGIRNQIPIVLGYTNSVKQASPLNIAPGETAIYNSTDFSLELKLTELRARFNGISSKIINGDAGQKLYADILGEMIELMQYLNTQTQTIYNTHIHSVGGSSGGALQVTIPALVIDSSNLVVVAPSGGGTCSVSGTTTPTPITLSIPPTPVAPVCPTTPPIPLMTIYNFTKPIVEDNTYVNNDLLFIDNNGVMPSIE